MNGYFPTGTSLEGGLPKMKEPKWIKSALVRLAAGRQATGQMTVNSELMTCQLQLYTAGLSEPSLGTCLFGT